MEEKPKKRGNPNFYKGMDPLPGAGRPKGSKDKVHSEIREAYKNLVEMNLENMSSWLANIAADDPSKAMDTLIKLSEFIIPKLARQELTGADGEDLLKNVKFDFGPDVNDTVNRIDE